MFELGVMGMTIPKEFGGLGLGITSYNRVLERIGYSCGSTAVLVSAHQSIGCKAVMLFGNDEQKKRWLPRLASGEVIGTFAFAEGAGEPDVASVATRFAAGKLNGSKVPVLDAADAGLAVVVAQDARGPVLVLVDLAAKGVLRRPRAG